MRDVSCALRAFDSAVRPDGTKSDKRTLSDTAAAIAVRRAAGKLVSIKLIKTSARGIVYERLRSSSMYLSAFCLSRSLPFTAVKIRLYETGHQPCPASAWVTLASPSRWIFSLAFASGDFLFRVS